tara:strand:- start:22 stop:1224 length:1203 start_codon:yes stop_codon:yes gene_type:complete
MKQNWKINNLSEVCDFQNGFAFKSKTFKDEGVPVLRISNIQNDSIDLDKLVFIDPYDYHEDFSKYEVKTGDLLIAMSGATTGKIGINTTADKFLLNQRVGKFIPKRNLNKKFLYYFLSTKVEESLKMSAGSAQPNLSTQQIKSFQIPIPDLVEQEKLVAKLDQCFESIDKARANVEKNLQNAKDLFQSQLNEIFSHKSEDWQDKAIGKMSETVTKGSSPKWQGISYVDENGILFITSENVGQGKLLFQKTKYVEKKFNDIEPKSILRKGDVLTNIVGASIGRTAVYDIDDIANINQAVCIIRCNEVDLHNYYLMYLLNSPFFKNILHDNEVNMARANLSLTFFRELLIPVPFYQKQKDIVNLIKSYEKLCVKLLFNYQQELDALDELKKSILQKAFNGEL